MQPQFLCVLLKPNAKRSRNNSSRNNSAWRGTQVMDVASQETIVGRERSAGISVTSRPTLRRVKVSDELQIFAGGRLKQSGCQWQMVASNIPVWNHFTARDCPASTSQSQHHEFAGFEFNEIWRRPKAERITVNVFQRKILSVRAFPKLTSFVSHYHQCTAVK